ncbi:nesprin-2, partial [Lates japonicus]
MVTAPTEITVVEKGGLSPTKQKPKAKELPGKEMATVILDTSEIFVKTADTIALFKPTNSELQEPKDRSKEAPEQTITQSTERDKGEVPQTQSPLSSESTDTPPGADYIDKLWKNTPEIQKRYLVLDIPDTGVTQTCEIKSVQPKAEAQPGPHEAETEVAEISPTELEIMKLSVSMSQLKLMETTQGKHKEDKDHGAQKVHAKVSTDDMQDYPESCGEKSSKIHVGPEVHILQPTSPEENENTSITTAKEPRIEIVETSTPSERVPQNKDVSTADVKPEKAEITKIKVQEQGVQEQPPAPLTQGMDKAPNTLDEKSVMMEKIQMGPEVRILQLDIQTSPEKNENTTVTRAKGPRIDIVQASTQSQGVPENKDMTTTDVKLEKAEMTKIKVQESSTESQDNVAKMGSAQPTSPAFEAFPPHEAGTEFIEISISEQDIVKPGQAETQTELSKATHERPKVVKECGVQEQPPTPLTRDMDKAPNTLDEKSVRMEKIHMGPEVRILQLDIQTSPEKNENTTVTGAKEQRIDIVQTSIQSQGVPENEDKTTSDVKLEKAEMTKIKEQVYSDEKKSPVSLQAVQRSSADVTLDEVAQMEGLPTQENKAEEIVVKTEKLVLEAPEGFDMRNIFTEIQLLARTGPSHQLIEGKSQEDAPQTLLTSTSELDGCLNRLVTKVLSCKNCPAELSPTAMAQQVEEAQQCRETAEAQLSLLQLRGADAENKNTLEHVEDQWRTAAQDAAAVIQSKEAQLQLVNDYSRQTQTAKTTMERQTVELDAVKMSPEQSSSKEAEQLSFLQRSMEENRTVFGELLVTYTKLFPHFSQSERATAQSEQKNLQEKWRGLERAVERTLHHTNVHSHETSGLQSEILGLQEHLETIDKNLEVKSPSGAQWNCKKAQQLMEANAEVKAAQQKYLHLQQLSDELLLSSRWEKETKEIQQGLQTVKDKLSHTEELVSTQTQSSSNPIMEKIIVVMRDGLAWAKQTETDIEGRRKRVALLPEKVHWQLRDLKKLQSEVMAKQGQLESLVEEVTELLPQLDQAEEVPMVRTSLESLEQLSKSTTDKLAKAVREIESGLQTREKMSEQIADLDSWVVAHLHREASRSADSEFRSPTELDRRVRQIQETLAEADKQAAVCEALLMKSKDISSELSITENCQLFEKLTNLQEDIRAISSYEKANKKELDELIQTTDSNKKSLVTIEKSLRQMLVDVSKHRFPITKESLQALEPFKHMILEYKSQVDLLQPYIPQEKTRELHSVISDLHSKMVTLEMKVEDHERYLNMRQCVEDLREDVQEQVRQTKEESKEQEEKYKVCQTLLVQFPLIRCLCEEAHSKLEMISADLYPSQLTAERRRLNQNEESINTLEMTLYNNLSIIEWNLLKELDLESEKKTTQAFLRKTQEELQKFTVLDPNETVINKEHWRIISLKKTVESRMRALEILEKKKGKRRGSGSQDLMVLKHAVLSECDSKMKNILQARESLRNYTGTVKQAVQFLRDIEVSLLPPQGSAGPCAERLEETQQALASLQQQFQTHVEQLQSQFALHPYLSPQKVEQLQENILSQLLVRMSTLQAKGHIRLECLSRCAESHRNYIKCLDEISQSLKTAENNLLEFISQKVTCLTDCTDQEAKFRALSEEVEFLLQRLEELREWCPEQSCRGGREATVAAVWKRVSRLRRCTQELAARSKQRIAEWSDITKSVEKASTVLEQVETELPQCSGVKASTEELHDLLQSWEQYQDRLDCEHRSLSAMELRAARLLGVPAHLEQAPPTPLCQQLQAMQARYGSVKQRSREGLDATRMELEEREQVREELQGVRVWLEAADGLLSEMEQNNSTEELQEVHGQLYTQKALLQRIMERLKIKYSDMYTLVPVEIEGTLQEVKQSLQQVEVKVGEAVERSGPVHRLGAKLSEIQAGLRSVQKRLEQRSPSAIEAKVTQKHVWDELDVWHSCLAALEVDMQDLEKPEEALSLTERLVEVQQLHSQLAKQAEQRTTLISKIHTWRQEHQEMISSSKSWMAEAQSWLAAPCTYTTAKCLSSHVQALQTVLNDSVQIRTTLQGFSSVLQEMSQVCDISTLQNQLMEADQQVANVQDSFTAPLSQLQHAAAEVEAIESEVRRMENDVAEIKTLLSSPEAFPSPREESLK